MLSYCDALSLNPPLAVALLVLSREQGLVRGAQCYLLSKLECLT